MVEESKISSGSYELDKLLSGGYEKDVITTFYGPGGSGKSNLCLMVATSQAKIGNKIIFVDTEGGFSVDRFKQIHRGAKDEIERDLQNVLILKPTSFAEQQNSFEQILRHVRSRNISLIIIDSMVMLYRLELGDAITTNDSKKISEVNRKMARQLRILNEIARKQNIPVIITNQVYSSFLANENNTDGQRYNTEREVSMVGGNLLQYWSKCLIELKNFRGKRKIVLKKHRSLPVKELVFEIVDEGIRKRGIF